MFHLRSHFKKSTLSLTSCIFFIFILSGCQHDTTTDSEDISYKTPTEIKVNWWLERHEKIINADKSNVEIVFLGDSITHRWEEDGADIWLQNFGENKALNLGFNGDKTQNLLWRIQNGELDNLSPNIAFLLIGTNNAEQNSSSEIAEGIILNITAIQEKLPNTKLVILSIFPRGTVDSNYRKITEEASQLVANKPSVQNIVYLNINEHFIDNTGNIPLDIMTDSLHLTSQGYATWANAIAHLLQ